MYVETEKVLAMPAGKWIVAIQFGRERLPSKSGWLDERDYISFLFEDGTLLQIWDGLYMCCEKRWMRCDDDLALFERAKYLGAELRIVYSGPADDPDVCFLIVFTSIGEFTVANYNRHNGNYAGWDIACYYTNKRGYRHHGVQEANQT